MPSVMSGKMSNVMSDKKNVKLKYQKKLLKGGGVVEKVSPGVLDK